MGVQPQGIHISTISSLACGLDTTDYTLVTVNWTLVTCHVTSQMVMTPGHVTVRWESVWHLRWSPVITQQCDNIHHFLCHMAVWPTLITFSAGEFYTIHKSQVQVASQVASGFTENLYHYFNNQKQTQPTNQLRRTSLGVQKMEGGKYLNINNFLNCNYRKPGFFF